jgi:hypothetical protein
MKLSPFTLDVAIFATVVLHDIVKIDKKTSGYTEEEVLAALHELKTARKKVK